MKIIDVEQGSDEWLEYRKGKVSGTMLGALYSKREKRKIGFYQMVADRLAIEPDDENVMDRGLRLEDEALKAFVKETGKIIERVGICVHDKFPEVIQSPDALIKIGDKYKEAVEVKCLGSAKHIQAIVENEVPVDHEPQMVQYFVVNPDLERLYFVFYDPRVTSKPLHIITVTRESLGDKPDRYLTFQVLQLKEINKIVEELAF